MKEIKIDMPDAEEIRKKLKSVKIDGNPYYYYDMPLIGGIRKRIYGLDADEIIGKVKAITIPAPPDNPTVKALMDYWLSYTKITKRARDKYLKIIAGRLSFQDIPAEDLTREMIEEYAQSLSQNEREIYYEMMTAYSRYSDGIDASDIHYEKKIHKKTHIITDFSDIMDEKTFLILRKVLMEKLNTLKPSLMADTDTPVDIPNYRYVAMLSFMAYMGFNQLTLKDMPLKAYDGGYIVTNDKKHKIPSILLDVTETLYKLARYNKFDRLFGPVNRMSLKMSFESLTDEIDCKIIPLASINWAYGLHLIKHGINIYQLSEILDMKPNSVVEQYKPHLDFKKGEYDYYVNI